jgi:hypothetical protein
MQRFSKQQIAVSAALVLALTAAGPIALAAGDGAAGAVERMRAYPISACQHRLEQRRLVILQAVDSGADRVSAHPLGRAGL